MRESRRDVVLAAVQAIGLHVALVAGAFFLLRNAEHVPQSAAGEPIEASLTISAADIARAQELLAAMKAPVEPKVDPPPLAQNEPQKMLDRPDTETQDAIDDQATEKTDQPLPEQEAKREQGQIDLSETEREERERKAKLLRQLAELQREQERASRLTRMEEERLKQVADRETQPAGRTSPMPAPPSTAPAGERGNRDDLLARYQAAMHQAANANWNRRGAAELVRCNVVFKQIPPGEVLEVRFEDCPFDAEGREFVERALKRAPMPYAGFETVFQRTVRLEFCHPEDACRR